MKQLLLVLGLLSMAAIAPSPAAVSPAAAATSTAPATVRPVELAANAPVSPPAAGSPSDDSSSTPKSAPPAKAGSSDPVRVQVVTSLGNFTIELLPERAPLTVAQFLKYVDMGHFSGTLFHRVIPNFVIQGGGYDTNYKLKDAPAKVVNESGNGLTNQRGTVGLARPSEPHAGDCQFYVNLFDNAALDPNQTRWGYAVFGRIVQGMEVVDRIGNVATGAKGPFKEDTPLKQVVIERIERVAASS